MGSFTPVSVSHHQLEVFAGGEPGDHLSLHRVGDNLVQVVGRVHTTVLTGVHTGPVGVRVVTSAGPPGDETDDWEAAAEVTLWSADGRVSVWGLMGDGAPGLSEIPAGPPGLLRVRVRARHRRDESHATEPPERMEQYEIVVWPVDVDAGFRTLRADGLTFVPPTPDRAFAAGWAMVRLVTLANPDPRQAALRPAGDPPAGGGDVPRVAVHRHRRLSAGRAPADVQDVAAHLAAAWHGPDLILPAGPVEVALLPVAVPDGADVTWRWRARPGSSAAVPDAQDSVVELRVRRHPDGDAADLTVTHRGLRPPDAILLGLVWDHLLDRFDPVAPVWPLPWERLFDELPPRPEGHHNVRDRMLAHFWGGTLPSARLLNLPANTIALSRLDRPLLDALARSTPRAQRAVARWAARRACATAGLDTVDWVAHALAALERDEPLPPPFDDYLAPWERLRADGRVTVDLDAGNPHLPPEAVAFEAVRAAAHDDPLAAAVNAVHFIAAAAEGERRREVLDAAAATLARLDAGDEPA